MKKEHSIADFFVFRTFPDARDVFVDENGIHEHSMCFKPIDAEAMEYLFLRDLVRSHTTKK